MNAQETPRFTGSVGGGFTNPVGNTGRHLDYGWNVRGGAGVNLSSHVGVNLNVGLDSMGINSSTLNNIGVPGGALRVFSATLDPIIHLNPKGHADVYVTGGGGLFYRYQEFTQPSVGVTTGFDPFFGFYPVAFKTNQVLGSYSVTKPGVDVGAGVAFGSKWHGKFFGEARYERIYMRDSHTDLVPVTFGFRW
jgi:hypothetical protein